jgi:hypothetical protein
VVFLSVAPVVAQQPPSFTLDPRPLSVSVGANATFKCAGTGDAPLYYQWQLGDTVIANATNTSLSLTNVQLADAGEYQVSLSNAWGRVLSKPAVLDVDPTFRVITLGRIVTDGGDSTGVAWGDFDGDGWPDLFVSNFGTRFNYLYHNNNGQTFTRIESGIVATEDVNAEGCAWADYDNDGDLDLFVAVGLSGYDLLYRNDGGGAFTKITNAPPSIAGGSSRGCAWADYDNDGWIDLFVANEQSQNNFLFRNDGSGGFKRVTTGEIALNRGNAFGCSWADYDNDGWIDLFVANNGARSFLYRNLGDGSFARMSQSAVATNVANSAGCAWGDYDNDGNLDLFVANLGQRNFLYRNNGDGSFTSIRTGAIVETTTASWGAAWADYDNDGFLDLFVVNGQPNGSGAHDFLFKNNGDGTFAKITRGSLVNDNAAGDGCAWADYNQDGFVDLFVSNFNGQNNLLYCNGGNSNHWLAIDCHGRISNASAIGTRLELTAEIGGKTVRQVREISGGGAYGSQNSLRVHFGLGAATHAAHLRVRWPSGLVQEIPEPPVDTLLTLHEPAQLTGVRVEAGLFRADVRAARNVPYRVEWSTNLVSWEPLSTDSPTNQYTVMNSVTGIPARFYRLRED